MPDFDSETIAPPSTPVLDTADVEEVSFTIRNGDLAFVTLRYKATNLADPTVPPEDLMLRRYATAMQFLIDFKAAPKAAVKAWLIAQTNESPVQGG